MEVRFWARRQRYDRLFSNAVVSLRSHPGVTFCFTGPGFLRKLGFSFQTTQTTLAKQITLATQTKSTRKTRWTPLLCLVKSIVTKCGKIAGGILLSWAFKSYKQSVPGGYAFF